VTLDTTVRPMLPLDPASRQALLDGTKLGATWLRQYGSEGARFEVGGETFEITGIVEFPLGYVADAYYRVEGYDSPEEFAAAWERLYPRIGFRPAEPVKFHTFRRVTVDHEGDEELAFPSPARSESTDRLEDGPLTEKAVCELMLRAYRRAIEPSSVPSRTP